MNNATAVSPVTTGIYAGKVEKITGLSMRALEKLHPDHFGSPGHFKFIPGVGGGVLYTPKGLVELVEALHARGYIAESDSLAVALRSESCEVALPAVSEPVPDRPQQAVVGYLNAWELARE